MSCEEFGEPRTWTTRDGEEIAYHDMTDSHLANAIAYLQRIVSDMSSGYVPLGEAAQDAFESALGEAEDILDELVDEQRRRKSGDDFFDAFEAMLNE